MNFSEAARSYSHLTKTENGALALNTTGSKLLDLFGTIGALREASPIRVERLFEDAYDEDPLLATKIAFYARDTRGGLGERKTFRTIIHYMAENYPEAILPNIKLIGEYGRFDDLYSLIGTPVEDEMWKVMKAQFEEDLKNLHSDKPISLLAKWIKTADASSEKTRELGILTAQKLGYKVYNFKRIVRAMRKKIKVTEALMSTNQWESIEYSEVPSRASLIYRNAFLRHDEKRYQEFISAVNQGKSKINASTLYPYDLLEKIWETGYYSNRTKEDETVEALWKALPNYVEEGTNALVIADVSGSMFGRPLYTSVGLAIYFAERNKGAYHNLWMSFSSDPHIHELKGKTLSQKVNSLNMNDWGMSTDLEAAFELVLNIALKNNVAEEDMPKSLIVISDMEIDRCVFGDWLFYDKMSSQFAEHDYQIPNIIFWNVNSRNDVFHADASRKGVQLASGQSVTVFKQVMDCVGMTPIEAMLKVINGDRYSAITVG